MKKFTLFFMLAFIGLSMCSYAQTINTFAGNGTGAYSGDGGAATSASLYNPSDVAFDNAGNLYITDMSNNRIRKVTTGGIITTIAGTGTAGFSGDGGAATSAKISTPIGITVDASGNIYFVDYDNSRVRKINTSGIISTVAGNGSMGSSGDGGAATSATLYYPQGIAVDNSGNLYIADVGNFKIRKVNTSGIISTFAGNGSNGFSGDGGAATSAQLSAKPYAVEVDGSGNVYIADAWNQRIRKVNSSGIISTIAGTGTAGFSGDGGNSISAQLNNPCNICIDASGNLYISDNSNQRIRKINTSGIISTIAGNGTAGFSGDGGDPLLASLNGTNGIVVNSSGVLYIADVANNRVRVLTSCVTPSTAATPTGTTQLCINPPNTNYTTTGATNATAYVWSISPSGAGVITGTGTTGTVDWDNTFTGTATISVKGTNGTGCEGAFSNTLTVTINPLPTVTFSALNSVCANASPFTLSGGSPNGGSYSGTGVSGNIFNPSVSGAGTFTITYIYTDGYGCSNSATQNITVNALPNVSISGLNSSYCQNAAAVTLNGTPSGGGFSGAGVNGTIFNPATAGVGTHSVTYTATTSGCTNSSTQNVTVNGIPSVSFSGLNPTYSSTDNPSTLIGSPAGGIFSGDGISGNIFSPSIAGIGSHNIVYVYTDGNGCVNATCETTDLATKVANISSPDNTINIFPNPNNGAFQVTFNVPTSQNIKIDVFNNIGQSVYTESKNNFNGQYNQTIDLSGLSKGVYLINTKIGVNVFTNKITIQN